MTGLDGAARECGHCGAAMTREGSASTGTHHTDWWSCQCGAWIKDSTPTNDAGQETLL